MPRIRKLAHIGTSEYIDLPDDGIVGVPAKIDTGADNSAIWASNIELKSGKLYFNFFAPGSIFYRSKRIASSSFKTTTVVNSFGHKEVRYKIRLRVQIGEHIVTRWFSLADRSGNTFPVLLGKSFLKNKFLVDVSQKQLVSTTQQPANVLILATDSTKAADYFTKLAERTAKDVNYSVASYSTLWYDINGMQTQVTHENDQQKDIADYGLVYFKSHKAHMELAAAAAEYLKFKNRRFVDSEVGSYTSMSKLSEYTRLACHDLPVPRTLCARPELLNEQYEAITRQLGCPFVLKEIASDRGRNNYLISNQADFSKVLAAVSPAQVYMAQKYIENDGFLRIYVLGKDAVMAVKRDTHEHKDPLKRHLNKPAGSTNAHLIEVSDIESTVLRLAVMAADCMDRQVAGVDLIQDKRTKQWHILEVNNAPQFYSGGFMETKMDALAQYIDKELNR